MFHLKLISSLNGKTYFDEVMIQLMMLKNARKVLIKKTLNVLFCKELVNVPFLNFLGNRDKRKTLTKITPNLIQRYKVLVENTGISKFLDDFQ